MVEPLLCKSKNHSFKDVDAGPVGLSFPTGGCEYILLKESPTQETPEDH